MKVEFRQIFLKDLRNIKNTRLLTKVRQAIENVEDAETPQQILKFKKLKGSQLIIASGSVTIVSV